MVLQDLEETPAFPGRSLSWLVFAERREDSGSRRAAPRAHWLLLFIPLNEVL